MTDATTTGMGVGKGMDKGTGTGAGAGTGAGTAGRDAVTAGGDVTLLLPHDESDKFELKLQHAVAGFVDGPRAAVEEADHLVEDIVGRLTDAMAQRRRTLRTSWQAADEQADTEQLRLALRDYRELADRLLHL